MGMNRAHILSDLGHFYVAKVIQKLKTTSEEKEIFRCGLQLDI